MLCGKLHCPIIVKARSLAKHSHVYNLEKLEGSSPPSVFVGRIGYPKVYIGPMLPPYHGDTTILDEPEAWIGRPIDEIVGFRYSLIRGKTAVNINEPQRSGRLLDLLQEVAMSTRSVDSEASFIHKPRDNLSVDDISQPFGPSAPLKSFRASAGSADRNIERCFYDHSLKANQAALDLHRRGVPVSKIQRSFCLGMFGELPRRKLVPTRWGITAVDNSISLSLLREVKQYEPLDSYRTYFFKNLDNIFLAVFMPGRWSFEWIEAWFPGTVWNSNGVSPQLMGDYEGSKERTTYAEVGGCYYSARLAAAEKLTSEQHQASVLILREIHKGYIMPVGVWNVRESVRAALGTKPKEFNSLQETLNYAMSKLTIPLNRWIQNSQTLQETLLQRRITDFLGADKK
jgi:hypothetical protein